MGVNSFVTQHDVIQYTIRVPTAEHEWVFDDCAASEHTAMMHGENLPQYSEVLQLQTGRDGGSVLVGATVPLHVSS